MKRPDQNHKETDKEEIKMANKMAKLTDSSHIYSSDEEEPSKPGLKRTIAKIRVGARKKPSQKLEEINHKIGELQQKVKKGQNIEGNRKEMNKLTKKRTKALERMQEDQIRQMTEQNTIQDLQRKLKESQQQEKLSREELQ